MDRIKQSMDILRETAVTLSARARAVDAEIAHNKLELMAKEQTIADLEERLHLCNDIARLCARKQAAQTELGELNEKLRKSVENVANWEREVKRAEQDCEQWKLLYEETNKHHIDLKKDTLSLRA